MKSKPVKDSITIMSHLMRPENANVNGLVHGGDILKLVDIASYICASRHSGKRVVTASFDKVNFWTPIKIGELVTFYASINFVGNSSMEVGVRVEAEDLKTCKKRHTNSCYVTMVSTNEKGKPIRTPKIIPQTSEQKIRFKQAQERRKNRMNHEGKD